jgi:hypothetical protein
VSRGVLDGPWICLLVSCILHLASYVLHLHVVLQRRRLLMLMSCVGVRSATPAYYSSHQCPAFRLQVRGLRVTMLCTAYAVPVEQSMKALPQGLPVGY